MKFLTKATLVVLLTIGSVARAEDTNQQLCQNLESSHRHATGTFEQIKRNSCQLKQKARIGLAFRTLQIICAGEVDSTQVKVLLANLMMSTSGLQGSGLNANDQGMLIDMAALAAGTESLENLSGYLRANGCL